MNNMTFEEYKSQVAAQIEKVYLEPTAPDGFIDETILNPEGVAILEDLMGNEICVNGAAGFMMGLASGALAAMDIENDKQSQSIETIDDLLNALKDAI